MGVIIRVLSHSPLARPLPAVILSALGLGGVAFVGLCATAPAASVATPPGAAAAHVGGQGPGRAAPARPGRRPHHVRLDRAVLPRARHDAVGQQPGLVAEPPAGLLDGRRRDRRAGEHHPGRLLRRRELRRLRADRRARLQPLHVPSLAASRRGRGQPDQPLHDPGQPVLADDALGLRAGGDLDAAAGGGDRRDQGLADPVGPDDHDGRRVRPDRLHPAAHGGEPGARRPPLGGEPADHRRAGDRRAPGLAAGAVRDRGHRAVPAMYQDLARCRRRAARRRGRRHQGERGPRRARHRDPAAARPGLGAADAGSA